MLLGPGQELGCSREWKTLLSHIVASTCFCSLSLFPVISSAASLSTSHLSTHPDMACHLKWEQHPLFRRKGFLQSWTEPSVSRANQPKLRMTAPASSLYLQADGTERQAVRWGTFNNLSFPIPCGDLPAHSMWLSRYSQLSAHSLLPACCLLHTLWPALARFASSLTNTLLQQSNAAN